MFTGFDTVHERDRRTDGRTSDDGIGRTLCSVAQQKLWHSVHDTVGRVYEPATVVCFKFKVSGAGKRK